MYPIDIKMVVQQRRLRYFGHVFELDLKDTQYTHILPHRQMYSGLTTSKTKQNDEQRPTPIETHHVNARRQCQRRQGIKSNQEKSRGHSVYAPYPQKSKPNVFALP